MVPLVPDDGVKSVLLKLYEDGRGLLSSDHPWTVRNYNELHSTREKPLMVKGEPPPTAWPVFKGESIQTWVPDTGIYYGWAEPSLVINDFLMAKRSRQARTRSSAFYGMPEEWVDDPTTLPCMAARVGWRKVARATDTRTVHVALIPPHVFVADHCYLLFFPDPVIGDDAFILGCMSSLPYDWVARRLVEVNLTAEILTAFPLPLIDRTDGRRSRVVEIAGRLAAVDDRYADWAEPVGVPVGSVSEDEKPELIAELDALVAHLYGLDRDDVIHIFETFHRGWDFGPRLEKVLGYFDSIGRR